MAEIYYQTRFYSDDEIKDMYLNTMRREDLRAIDKGFVANMFDKNNLRVKRKCFRNVSIKCDKEVTVHYEAHKKVEETTGYTVTRRVDVMNLVDYKVTENTKDVTYVSSYDYTKKFYGVSNWDRECVEENFYIKVNGGSQGRRSEYSKTMPDVYKNVKPWTGLTQKIRDNLDTSSGCSSQVSDCRKDIQENAKYKGYVLDFVEFKSATVSNVVVEKVEYDVSYYLEFAYNGMKYSFEIGEYGLLNAGGAKSQFPKSKEYEKKIVNALEDAKIIKNKAKCVTVPTIIISSIGILLTIVGTFMHSFSEHFPMIIASLVFNIWYFWWVGCRLFKEVNDKSKSLKDDLKYGAFVDNTKMPEIKMTSLIIKSLVLTLFNLFCCALPFVQNF